MKATLTQRIRSSAFTLVELMIVIGIIAVLAAMIFPAFSRIKQRNYMVKAKAELQQLEVAIGSYKTRQGFLPPSNPLAAFFPADRRKYFALNPLFFELKGTKLAANSYQSLDNLVTLANADVATAFDNGITGFMNSTRGGGDESAPAQDYLRDLKPGQFCIVSNVAGRRIVLLTCSVDLPKDATSPLPGWYSAMPDGRNFNPWRYNSSSPTNNPGHYDLWVDLIVGGKTNRISNWSSKPQIVYDP